MKARLTKSIFITALTLGMLGVVGAAYATVTINATAVTSDGALTLTGAGASTWSLSSGALDIDSAGALSLNSSAGAVNLGNDAVAQAINIGTGLAARTITVGNETGTTSVEIDSGTGAINIGNAIAKIITIGNTTGTTGLVFNVGTGGYDLNFVAGAELDITSAASTVTDGVLDINVDSAVTGGFEVINLGLTVNDGATATDNFDALSITLTANDADADVFGIRLTAADTANAAAGSYEAGISIDNADTTAASMTDAILITSSGVNLGITDAIDVSAANILNAINIGANNIQTGTGGTVTFARSDTGIVTLTAVDDDATADITLDAGGAGAIVIGSADVTSVTITVDGATDGDLVLPLTSVSGAEMVNNTVTATQLAATLTLADADFVDLGLIVHNDAAAQGLRLPNSDGVPTAITANPEGHISWDATNNLLYVSTDAGWASTFTNTASANTWTGANTFTLAGAENLDITHDLAADLTTTSGVLTIKVTPSAVAGTQNALYISQEDSANTEPLDVGIEIDNVDTDLALVTGVLFTSAAGGITTAIDASAANVTTALSVGANPITGTSWNLNAGTALTLGDVATGTNAATVAIFSSDWEISATGVMTGIGAITSDGTITSGGTFTGSGATTLDATGAATITIGSADVTGVTFITDGGAVTVGSAGTANGDGVRIGNGRVTVNKPTAPVDCADAACTPTVTQILEAGIFFGTPTGDKAFTLPAVQGATGLVQALPGTPAVGDVFSFVIANKSAVASGFEITLAATASPAGYTLGSLGTVAGGTTTTFYCRVTAVTADNETITCY